MRPLLHLKLAAIVLASFLTSLFFSFTTEKESHQGIGFMEQYTREFEDAVNRLDSVANEFLYGKAEMEILQNAVLDTRLAYKKIEFFLGFQYPEYNTGHFNGAPLLQIKRDGSKPDVVAPEGLQVLDELVFSEEAFSERTIIASTARKLKASYGQLYASLQKTEQTFPNAVPAMRLQLVRLFSMGVTGFDTPGSLNALPETEASLAGMKLYFDENHLAEETGSAQNISLLFKEAMEFVGKAESFETFDRLEFLRRYIDPLYKALGEMEPPRETALAESSGWNAESVSLFSEDFLNPYFYTDIKAKEDSNEMRALGKTLFYDPRLSNSGTISCVSCHNPDKAFTDQSAKSASNVQGKTVLRNSPTLLNAVYSDRYFYDLRAFTLEQQAEHVIFNVDEFNTAYSNILSKLEQDAAYSKAFKDVFGKGNITRETFSKALASYVLSLKSFNSPFDQYARNETNVLDEKVKNGFNLFMGKANCATCHFAPTFSGLVPPFYNENESEILGVLQNPRDSIKTLDADGGRMHNRINSEEAWIYDKSFKTTTVRNTGLTAPYFHNGAYETLEEVIDFYNDGGGEGLGLVVVNQTLSSDPLGLTDTEKTELIAFMESLNDTSVVE